MEDTRPQSCQNWVHIHRNRHLLWAIQYYTNPEFAADTDQGKLLGINFWRASSLRKELSDKVILADSHQLLQRRVKGIIVFVQKLILARGIGKI